MVPNQVRNTPIYQGVPPGGEFVSRLGQITAGWVVIYTVPADHYFALTDWVVSVQSTVLANVIAAVYDVAPALKYNIGLWRCSVGASLVDSLTLIPPYILVAGESIRGYSAGGGARLSFTFHGWEFDI